MTELPSTLSGLLRLAVRDAKAAARRKGVKLDMGLWLGPAQGEEPCRVCMAGAVLIQSFGHPLDKGVDKLMRETKYESPIKRAMLAINEMRMGMLAYAYAEFIRDEPAPPPLRSLNDTWRDIWEEEEMDGRLSWARYNQMADELEAAGF